MMAIELLLENVNVITLDPFKPRASFVAVQGDRIAAVGELGELRALDLGRARRIDCQGLTLVPGFNDAHCHLLAYAASLGRADCRPGAVSDIEDIVRTVRDRAKITPPGQWVRAFGYDEYYLREGRHPTRWDLDRATTTHPVRLDHRTGHASVLNSAGLALLDIGPHTPDPIEGVIDRDDLSSEPTGLLLEMAPYLRGRTGDRTSRDDLGPRMREANAYLLSAGITSIQDASPANDPDRWQLFRRLKQEGQLTPRVSMMMGVDHLDSFSERGLAQGHGDASLRLGAVKVMLSLTTGALHPPSEQLDSLVANLQRQGYQIAIHAVEDEAVRAAVAALGKARQAHPRKGVRHRIEHCSECPPESVRLIADSGAMIVSQPAFPYLYGDKYQAESPPELVPHLYPFHRWHKAGIRLAAGSDAPVAPPDPLLSMGAVTRCTSIRKSTDSSRSLPPMSALRMHTLGGAYTSLEETQKGTIEVGKLADLVLLSDDPTVVEPAAIKNTKVVMTVVGGRTAWEC